MAFVFANSGELLALQWMFKSTTTPENLTLKLFKNDYTPTATSTAGDFTEADFTNYSAKTLSRASWGTPSTVSGKASIAYDSSPQTWTCGTTGNVVYGFLGNGHIWWLNTSRHFPEIRDYCLSFARAVLLEREPARL